MSSSAPVRTGYHHGDLRNALIRAAADLAQSGGPASVTIRAAARAVGVTPTAAYRHFAGHEELLHAAKEEAMERLSAAMSEVLTRVPETEDRVRRAVCAVAAIGRGYLNFAQAEPGLFRTAFAAAADVPAFATTRPFLRLVEALDELAAAGYLPAERRPMAEIAAWSSVHGLAMLCLDGPLRSVGSDQRRQAMGRVVEVVMEGLGGRALSPGLRADILEFAR
ncbi:TetR/AcrR family transcriptional regulator [Amycolatopsis alkalitolerans]|uniref:TetR/AcrR family transcriptional regulator n=1 Tax=Amycolatopsis alkalitolerans TaxID=2547244 RepID=A0A5C4LZZ1_9PSEU|nr:TetR/AcrR family transcriptional regulator [Amycolatopsis alkalitolerans]TNC25442.1 TetR/AcrR family transcriptional regulator [Amycolatopsis alkalitolerans]